MSFIQPPDPHAPPPKPKILPKLIFALSLVVIGLVAVTIGLLAIWWPIAFIVDGLALAGMGVTFVDIPEPPRRDPPL